MLLQILLQEWEWKNKAIPRTPVALKKTMKGLLEVYMMDYLLKARCSKVFSKKPKEDRKETNKQVKVVCKIFHNYVCMEYHK